MSNLPAIQNANRQSQFYWADHPVTSHRPGRFILRRDGQWVIRVVFPSWEDSSPCHRLVDFAITDASSDDDTTALFDKSAHVIPRCASDFVPGFKGEVVFLDDDGSEIEEVFDVDGAEDLKVINEDGHLIVVGAPFGGDDWELIRIPGQGTYARFTHPLTGCYVSYIHEESPDRREWFDGRSDEDVAALVWAEITDFVDSADDDEMAEIFRPI